MKLEDIYTEIATDFPINEHDLGHESIKSEKLWVKYITLWSKEKMQLEARQSTRATLVAVKREYYSGNASEEVYKVKPFNGKSIKSDAGLDRAIASDPDVISHDEGTIIQKNKVEVLKAAVDECKQRGYSIKNALSNRIFEGGG